MDLNLYPVFLEIMRHGSVSKAAESLGLTQSATSNALGRLREQMGDPLFVRTRKGMLPTHYAKNVRPQVERALEILGDVPTNLPAEIHHLRDLNRHFTIVMSDLEETLFLPELVERLAEKAPRVRIEVRQFQRENLQENLERGRIDFVLAYLTAPIKNIVSQPVSKQEFVCVARTGHPKFDGPCHWTSTPPSATFWWPRTSAARAV